MLPEFKVCLIKVSHIGRARIAGPRKSVHLLCLGKVAHFVISGRNIQRIRSIKWGERAGPFESCHRRTVKRRAVFTLLAVMGERAGSASEIKENIRILFFVTQRCLGKGNRRRRILIAQSSTRVFRIIFSWKQPGALNQ